MGVGCATLCVSPFGRCHLSLAIREECWTPSITLFTKDTLCKEFRSGVPLTLAEGSVPTRLGTPYGNASLFEFFQIHPLV
jgi:hypothetical protein